MTLRPIDPNRKIVDRTVEVEGSAYEPIPVGNYNAIFDGVEEIETKRGIAWRWVFKIEDGEHKEKIVSQLSGTPDDVDEKTGNRRPPTVKNRCGKFLCAISKSPLKKGVLANPAEYIGKRYMLIIEPKPDTDNDTQITTFTMLD